MPNQVLHRLTPLLLLLAVFIGGSVWAADDDDVHRVVIQVNSDDPALMNLALNNALNINKYYQEQAEDAVIELVTYGPGLTMLRSDTSPVKARVLSLAENFDNISYKACANTKANMERKSGKPVPLIEGVEVVPSGVIHVIQRQEEGWAYIKP